ncbi:BA14K family protein [Faunimonas pinastri]|uniref:BA14K family protein n=1 Tax=Faunimonas pinastri TaxID=1855383 RepID=UPI001EEC567A|nr:BA14K family protein [Faunimonas pinastri]
MNRIITALVAGFVASATVVAAASPAFADEPWMRGNRGGFAGDHGGHHGGRDFRGHDRHGGGWDRGHHGYRHGYNRHDYYRHRHHGDAGAAAAFGLAAGAIAGAAASSASHGSSCAARFKSYNPRTHTYLGYDGQRHVCR